mmetsp:Transcript_8073/g.11089  ORF Transcript_8073/g.11089 Transcript_8073/m.11089 type:complete len:460 (+) Transcript_8073:62-1441(+)
MRAKKQGLAGHPRRLSPVSAALLFIGGMTVGFGLPKMLLLYVQVQSFGKNYSSHHLDAHRTSFTSSSPSLPLHDSGRESNNNKIRGDIKSLLFPSISMGENNEIGVVKEGESSLALESGDRTTVSSAPVSAADASEWTDCRASTGGGCKDKALIFTMDSIQSRVDESKSGGASGEITIRLALQNGLANLGVESVVARSDAQFESQNMGDFKLIFLDPWTWAGRGWKLKAFLRAHTKKIFLLDFFGGNGHESLNSLVPLERHLTAFPVHPSNTFLGYYIDDAVVDSAGAISKKNRGVIWGKDPKYFKGKEKLLRKIASICPLVSTASISALPSHPNITSVGHQSPEQWQTLLAKSKFLVGLGDPLIGPSAIDSVVAGAMYLNPHYPPSERKLGHYSSQHPFVEKSVSSNVCGFRLDMGDNSLDQCVRRALAASLSPQIPKELTKPQYMQRLQMIVEGADA